MSRSRELGRRLDRWLCVLTGTALVSFALASAVAAETAEIERPSLEVGWTETPPIIDGRLDAGEWEGPGYIDGLTQATPDQGMAPTQRTEIWVMGDEDNLYIAARLWDTHPEEIVAATMIRDGNTYLDDRFGFSIDPFLDRQNGYFFQVNPNGARRDLLLEGGQADASWDGRWYAKASVDDQGWTVEIRLPYQTINFDPEANVWGLNMARGIRRRNEIDRWADPVRERFVTAMGRAGDLVGMLGIEQGLGLQIVPAGALRRVDDVNDPPDTNERRHYTRADPSLDVFYKITPQLTTSVTVNTDFGETAVDERQINLSRFELFFPEQRDFFLQDGLIFDFGDLSKNGRPFFSRRIGLSGEGEPLDIVAGGKVTGRTERFKMGVLNVLLDEHDDVDQSNVFVARPVTNFGESTLGAIATYGDPEGLGTNAVVGSDFIYRNSSFLGDKTLRASIWVQNSFSDPNTGPTSAEQKVSGSGLAYGGAVSYPNDKHNWEVAARSFDGKFNPALGFANRVGIREVAANYRRRWRPEVSGIQTVDSRVAGALITDMSDSIQEGLFTWRAIEIASPVEDSVFLEYRHRYEFVQNPFDNFDVPLGRYHFDEASLRFRTSQNRVVSADLELGYGTFYDGTRARVRSDIRIRISKYVQTSVVYQIDDIRLPNGDERIHLLLARLSLFFTPDISWVTLVQYDNVSDSMALNSRFRWIIEDGRELFLVFNQDFDTSDDVRAVRVAPLAKLQWTFRF